MTECGREASVLLVTRNFPPLLGGMERLNRHLLGELRATWRTLLCGPAGCASYVGPETVVRESRAKSAPLFLLTMLWKALVLSRQQRPAWVLAGSGLTAPIAWLAARCSGARMAVYLHGLDVIVPNPVYQRLWLPFIRQSDLILANSNHTARLAVGRDVPEHIIRVLHPGTDFPELDAGAGEQFRSRHGFGSRPLLLSVGRLTERKGLANFVRGSLPAIAAAHPDVTLVIIGNDASNALHARRRSERGHIMQAAAEAGVEKHLQFLGPCDDATLAAAYQAADIHVFPVLDLPGDVEGFGMVALESAAHGLRTVAFAVGGVPDAVEEGVSGQLIAPGDYDGMSQAVLALLSNPACDVSACRQFAAEKAWPEFGKQLRAALEHHDGP